MADVSLQWRDKLVELTEKDAIVWEDKEFWNNYETGWQGWRFSIEWLHDDRPTLSVSSPTERTIGFRSSIYEGLFAVVREQQRRRRLGRYAPEEDVKLREIEKRQRKEEERMKEEAADLWSQFQTAFS